MKVRTTIAGTALSAMLPVLGCGTVTILASAAITACSGSSSTTPDAGGTSFSSEPSTSPNPGVTTETVTASASPAVTSNPTASPVTAAPATGGGGTAGTQDALLFVIGGAAVLAGAGSFAYRRKVMRNR